MKNLSLATLAMLGGFVRRRQEHPERSERPPIAGVSQVGRGKKPTYYCPNCKCYRYHFCTCALPVEQRKRMVYRKAN